MKNQHFDNDKDPLTNRLASSSGTAPTPFDKKPPTDEFSDGWSWNFAVRPLLSGERAICKVMVGADDLATLTIDDKFRLELPPRGDHGGGTYDEIEGELDVEPGLHYAYLTTWRASDEEITTNPSGRTDGDTTTWSYYDAGGLVQKKTYADGTHEDSEYNALNMGVKKTDARGIVTTYTWDTNKGVCTKIDFSDGTPAQQFTYNHLANMYKVVDASGTRNIAYNIYNEQETDGIAVNGAQHTVSEAFDAFGRSAGYVLGKGATALDTVAYGYGAEGRLATTSFLHGGEEKTFTYSYLEGTNLLHTIAHPNNIIITRTYEQNRDLINSMYATRGTTNVVLRGYTYDEMGRSVTRTCARLGTTRNDSFSYNNKGELVSASLGSVPYSYAYDNIGNRETAEEAAQALTTYTSNPLNQYSGITQGTKIIFTPEYDLAGNQTKIKTSTGIWTVVYDANNRPTNFTSEDGQTAIACGYDYMGRRFMKKVIVGESTTLHQFYLYRGYLQIAALDLTRTNVSALWFTHWDPTEPVATRPLSIRKNGTWYTYGHDLTKNVTALYKTDGTIAATYDYTPYGAVTATGIDQPFQWSSEIYDAELGLVYYNYRHYNPNDGRWNTQDIYIRYPYFNLYEAMLNNPIFYIDLIGLKNADNACIQTTDSFSRSCCPEKIQKITKYILKPFTKNHEVGHAFISCPNSGTWGKYPAGNPVISGGDIRDDSDLLEKYKDTDRLEKQEYRACPESVKKMGKIIKKERKDPSIYSLGGAQCEDWVDDLIKKTDSRKPSKDDPIKKISLFNLPGSSTQDPRNGAPGREKEITLLNWGMTF